MVVACGLLVPALASAQRSTLCDASELEVRSLVFRGNRAFPSSQLAAIISLTASDASSRLGVLGDVLRGVRRCGNPALVAIDRARLTIYYRRRGYPDVQVDTIVQRSGQSMDLRFVVREGRVTTIDTLRVIGLDSIADRARITRDLPIERGQPFDQYLLEQTRDTLRRRLADVGYPFAQVLLGTDVVRGTGADSTMRTAVVEFGIRAGPVIMVRDVVVRSSPREGRQQEVPSDVVKAIVGVRPGQRYAQSDVERATRALYLTDAYQQVRIEPVLRDSVLSTADSARVDVVVTLAERFMRSRSLSAGYGTLDCFRTQVQYTNRNLFHRARRLEVTARVSKLGVGEPIKFNGTDRICGQVANGRDPYSERMNYYVGATLRPPVGPGGVRIPEVTLYSEVRGEFQAYQRNTPIGAIASVTLQAARRLPVTLAYDLSYGSTEAQPALFCSVLSRCAPEDQRVFTSLRRLAVVGANFSRDRTDNPVNPREGSFLRLALRHASRFTLSDSAFQFSSAVLDASKYWPLGSAATLAVRAQLGAIFGNSERLVPPQERLYAGGPTTVRGFRQNELGPVAYLVNADTTTPFIRSILQNGDTTFSVNPAAQPFRIVPVGGNTVAVGNVELRLRSPFAPNLLQWTLFTDFGQVWSRGGNDPSLRDSRLRVTPGLGARVFSPIGVIRLDFGYNNYPSRDGAAYFNELPLAVPLENGTTQQLLCVSPGNTIPAGTQLTDTGVRITQRPYTSCPGGYTPRRNRGILGPFTFFFAIGQAF